MKCYIKDPGGSKVISDPGPGGGYTTDPGTGSGMKDPGTGI